MIITLSFRLENNNFSSGRLIHKRIELFPQERESYKSEYIWKVMQCIIFLRSFQIFHTKFYCNQHFSSLYPWTDPFDFLDLIDCRFWSQTKFKHFCQRSTCQLVPIPSSQHIPLFLHKTLYILVITSDWSTDCSTLSVEECTFFVQLPIEHLC